MQSDPREQGRLLAPRSSLRPAAIGLTIALLALAVDQLSKLVITARFSPNQLITSGSLVRLVYVTNTGGVCGYAQGANEPLAILGLVTTLLIGVSLFFLPDSRIVGAAFGLLLAGASGNLLDRIRLGHVIDFISVEILGWPAFNLADTFIIAGIGVIGLLFLLEDRRDQDSDQPTIKGGQLAPLFAIILTALATVAAYVFCVFRPFD